MPTKQPTIYDVAKLAKVSTATVSRVLNQPSKVNKEKKETILSAIETLHFVPKADAVALARKKLRKIGVVAPFFTESSFMERLKGIASVLTEQHYELVIYAVQSDEDLQGYLDMLIVNNRVDGLILLCLSLKDSMIEKLRASTLPVCFVETDVQGFDSVVIDNSNGGSLAGRFLYENGYRTPGFVGEASRRTYAAPSTEERFAGYSSFFASKGISLEPQYVWMGDNIAQTSMAGILKILDRPDRPDCLFASSDTMAIRILKCAVQLGITVPDDLGVIGFDDIEMAEFVNLTTVNQSLEESGILAAETILWRLKEPDRPTKKNVIELTLHQRSSTEVKK
ncbi:LacI family DNA-binding transcriptional regulator [uncultured Sphaerochaeta sp.]|uniref:LacI family DNA-binding transcriptional regulator n=1 Tax=uncultured Sphaerochaeta sp. TaxID=886478 RepID=UPI002A0A40F2|nr:LacI family DNA-binding transcriptional regulator [uncultured Sphaerochaeta sp.]